MSRTLETVLAAISLALPPAAAALSAEPASFAELRSEYQQRVQPLLKQYCLDCHATDTKEGELDLERFARLDDVRSDPQSWVKVSAMLAHGEMPPEDSDQPTADEKQLLHAWVQRFLDAEARASAGDPGPVILRRLSNAEYTYTVRDLTGVQLDPAKEFPVDGAAGEGFTNTGNALVMSPALFMKYLDAAKGIADHAVLLPDGIRFSPRATRRDWTNEILAEIQAIYRRNTSGYSDASELNRWDVSNPLQASDADGRVDLSRYFAALVRHRQRLQTDRAAAAIAKEENLNAKYFALLAEMLTGSEPQSLLLDRLRERWRTAKPQDAAAMAAEVRTWQDRLWKFNSVGHFGSIRKWQQPVDPLVETVTLRQPIDANAADDVTFYLAAGALDGKKSGVVWGRPRIEFKDRPAIPLRDIRPLAAQVESTIAAQLARTEEYLAAVVEAKTATMTLETLAQQRKLDAALLRNWTNYLDLGRRVDLSIAGLLTDKMTKVDGYEAINGWGVPATPCIFANSSEKPISFLTLTVPARGVTVHPSPELSACIGWRSPIAGRFKLAVKLADTDNKCGNGATWSIELRSAGGVRRLAEGVIENGQSAEYHPDEIFEIARGEVIVVAVGPRNRDHSCDTTHLELTLVEQGGEARTWNLASDVADDIQAGNPHADRLGNANVWYLFAIGKDAARPVAKPLPVGSALARWREAAAGSAKAEELQRLTREVQTTIATADRSALGDADQAAVRELTSWTGPLAWATSVKLDEDIDSEEKAASTFGVDPAQFGRRLDGRPIDRDSLIATAPSAIECRLPAALVRGGELIVDVALDDSAGESVAQVELRTRPIDGVAEMPAAASLLSRPNTAGREKLTAAFHDFRAFFPAAMCYARIVPVDEVVTLVLFHREDEELSRLMLDDADAQRLDRLWAELNYVSQHALISAVAFEQLMEFATQDADPKVFEPLRKPISDAAAAYRQQLLDSQPAHVAALVELVARAYRRPLTEQEARELPQFYASLREQKLTHDEAIRLTLARILTSPAFLYRLEQAGPNASAVDVSDAELASRMSYFLWSSMPDDELRAAAAARKLHDAPTLTAQTRRMLRDERTRRLAIEFGCQWLHVRDFDQLDEKSERRFPKFVDLRGEMYEESIQFFADLVQNDGRVLDLLDADHTFLNAKLAQHYGIPNVEGDQWRKVADVKRFGRGGVLTQATVLAQQSGASRTSPILRGNWLSETLLGERLPRPPKDVPQLPETVPQGLTERQLIERHTHDAACAKCHARIDPYGFALEQYDAIGRLRERDTENHPIDTKATLPDDTQIAGVDGLREYLLTHRRDDFSRQFCRKLIGYALGRSVQLSDQPLIDKMLADLAANDYRFSVAVEAIVSSPQFRQIRGSKFAGVAAPSGEDN